MEVPMPIDFPMPGAFSSEQPCNQEVRDLVAQTAEQLTAALNGRNPGEITAVSFRMQIVAGEMYIVKVSTANGGYFLMKIWQRLPGQGGALLMEHQRTQQIPIF